MSVSALAACMAPLLLRPLLAGDCEFEDDFNMGGDGSIQLLKAAAAANHAQAIIIILLEKYDIIFDVRSNHCVTRLPVRGPPATRRYHQNRPLMVDFGHRQSIEGEIDRRRSIEGEKGKKKKKRKRRRGEEE
ncbi:hypothetical protein B296_00054225 [Ensete ventricosum]|uniref:Rho-GAP domain-containing protein n=1 Tax=Ensete ventricosum TaxID=4639 RepID=A0A426Y4V4_ENSVE|nr:hypothetical protein B296_00054225 [Ensete ventricosum]